MEVIWVGWEREYFLIEDWTTQITLMGLEFLFSSRMVIDAAFDRPFKTNSFVATPCALTGNGTDPKRGP
jgi:hypothetical protein